MSPEMRRAKLAKLCEIEGFEDENDLFAAAISDSVCPAICCNPDNPECDYTAEMEPDQDRGWCESASAGPWFPRSCSGASSDVGREDPGAQRRVPDDDDRRPGHDDRRRRCPALGREGDGDPAGRDVLDFTEDNDPHGEHDFGSFELAGRKFFWKIDYYDANMEFGSEDPADPAKTTRVLTIMLAEEY